MSEEREDREEHERIGPPEEAEEHQGLEEPDEHAEHGEGADHELRIRRILVALDTSSHSLAALRAAVELAHRFSAELEGLFVEDSDLLRTAGYSSTHEIGVFSARSRRLDAGELEREVHAHARWARRVFTLAGRRARLTQSFAIVRGKVATEVIARAAGADVLILGRRSRSVFLSGSLGSTTRAVLTRVTNTALIVQEDSCVGPPFVVFYDGTRLADKALHAALRIVGEHDPVVVLLAKSGAPGEEDLSAQARRLIAIEGVAVSFRTMTQSGLTALASAIAEEDCGTLIVPGVSPLLDSEALASLVEELDIPVLIVR